MNKVTCSECGRPPTGHLRKGLCGRCYQRRRRIDAGIGYVSPEAAVKHLRMLHERGLGLRKIARAAGLAVSTIQRLPKRPAIDLSTEKAILSIPIPEIDTAAVAHRALCIAGASDEYISIQRRYRSKFIRQRHRLLAERRHQQTVKARRAERERQAHAKFLESLSPPARTVHGLRCGDCEVMPCQCIDNAPDDYDLWMIRSLADHDPEHAPAEVRCA